MKSDAARIPSSSQTVGPYFCIGLQSMIARAPAIALETPGMVAIEGQVSDRNGAPVPDAMLEFWSAATESTAGGTELESAGFPTGFRRAITENDGRFSVIIERPETIASGDNTRQAPHFMVLVFARGLLRQLLTRVYLGGPPCGEMDPVLSRVPEERRETLIAAEDERRINVFQWNVKLQGPDETVFFAW